MNESKYQKKFSYQLNIPNFPIRYEALKNSKKKNVIYIKNSFDNSTFRYRAYNVIEAMENSKKYFVTCFNESELDCLYNLIDKIDLIIFQRAKWSFKLDNFITILKSKNINVIYDMDDLVYNPKHVPEYLISISDCSDYKIDKLFEIAKRYELVADRCDGYLVTTEKLAEHFKKDFKKKVWLLNNFINKEQEIISKEILKLKKISKRDKFIIGYFSGSNTHRKDLDIAESALVSLMRKYDDIYLKIVGIMDLSETLKKLKEQGRVLIDRYVSYEELQYKIGEVDLNIIPLQQHDFNDCKSELKYFEASIVNVPTIASVNLVYSKTICDKKDGFLCKDMEWFEKLEYIYLNYDKMNFIIENAYKKCYETYGVSKQKDKISKIYDEILNE